MERPRNTAALPPDDIAQRCVALCGAAAGPRCIRQYQPVGERLRDGVRVEVVVSDPWDFVDAAGANTFAATVTGGAEQDALHRYVLLLLDNAVVSESAQTSALIAVVAHNAPDGPEQECHLYGTDFQPSESVSLEAAVHQWRGGLAARGVLRPVDAASSAGR